MRLLPAIALLGVSLAAAGEQTVLAPIADATLFEDNPDFASGAGDFLFIGPIASGSPRRALLRFGLSSIPSNAIINAVTLRFVIDRAAIGSRLDDQARLHKVLAEWGEGNSNGGTGGAGTPAASGDATWNVRFFGAVPPAPWTHEGGDFATGASASVTVGGIGSYTVPSTPALVQDVQQWLLGPAANFGWFLLGPEGDDVSQRARRLYGRSAAAVDSRPQLTVDFSLPAEVETRSVPIPEWSLLLLAAALLGRGGSRRYRCVRIARYCAPRLAGSADNSTQSANQSLSAGPA